MEIFSLLSKPLLLNDFPFLSSSLIEGRTQQGRDLEISEFKC